MKKIEIIALIHLVTLLPAQAFFGAQALFGAQAWAETLTLDQAIEKSAAHSPDLASSRARTDLARWQLTESLSGFLPTIGMTSHWVFYERTPLFKASLGNNTIDGLPPASPWLDLEANLKWPLFDGLKNFDRYGAAEKVSQSAELEFDYGSFSLREKVRLAFYNILAAKALARVASEDVKDLKDHKNLIEKQIRVGVDTKIDILRVDTELNNALSEETHANDDVEIHRQELAQLLGSGELGDFSVSGELPKPDEKVLNAIEQANLGRRADIEALSIRAEAAQVTQRADSKWWLPSLSATAGYDAFTGQATKITAYTLGFELNWKIFDGLVSYARSKESIASEQVATFDEESSRLQAKTDFETYRRRYRYNLQKYRAQVDDVKQSTESVRLARAGFMAGTETNTDVLDAERDLFNARANSIQAQYGALESLIHFELAIGRSVTHD